jgi:O-acetyl-ADP-ribose deacetylase (regulator of RNase III)
VAFPAISTGVYRYPAQEAAPVAISAVMGAETNVKEVRFVLYSADLLEVFRAALDAAEQ